MFTPGSQVKARIAKHCARQRQAACTTTYTHLTAQCWSPAQGKKHEAKEARQAGRKSCLCGTNRKPKMHAMLPRVLFSMFCFVNLHSFAGNVCVLEGGGSLEPVQLLQSLNGMYIKGICIEPVLTYVVAVATAPGHATSQSHIGAFTYRRGTLRLASSVDMCV
jgi:hypothetical protein